MSVVSAPDAPASVAPASIPKPCTTCGKSQRWGTADQCYGCLRDRVRPCDEVFKREVCFDSATAHRNMRAFRDRWERAHPGFRLVTQTERMWPEVGHKSKYVDRDTRLIRKLFYCKWRVERR